MNKPEIHKMLAVSTGNLHSITRDWLDEYKDPLSNRIWEYPIIVYGKGGYGWFIPIIKRDGVLCVNSTIPIDLYKIIKYADSIGCSWVMFDRDADPLPGIFNYYE